MGTERIVGHQLPGHLLGKVRFDTAAHIDLRQLLPLESRLACEFAALAREIGLLGVGLGTHRNIFSRCHRHGTGDQSRHAGDQHVAMRRRHTDDQARRRNDPVICPQHRGAEPANA